MEKTMKVEDVLSMVESRNVDSSKLPVMPTQDLCLLFRVMPEEQGKIHIPEQYRSKMDGIQFFLLAKGPEAETFAELCDEVMVGNSAEGTTNRTINLGADVNRAHDGFFLVGASQIVGVINPEAYHVLPEPELVTTSGGPGKPELIQ